MSSIAAIIGRIFLAIIFIVSGATKLMDVGGTEAMITGAGFSFWNGGLTMRLDIDGISEKVTGRRFH